MPWKTIVTESVSSPNLSAWQVLDPNEGIQIHFTRTAGTGDVRLHVWASIDASLQPEVPLFSFTMDAADDIATIPISGPLYSIATSSDSGTFEVKFRSNGGIA